MSYPAADRNAFLTSQITGTGYIALYTTAPDDDGSGGTECTGGSYARVAHSAWTTASAGNRANDGAITFPTATADWGTIVAATWMSAASGGTQKAVTDTFTGGAVTSGITAEFATGVLDFNFA